MTTALCLYGEPRDIDKTYDLYRKYLIEPNNITDIFVHTWHEPDNVGQLYNPSKEANGNYCVPNIFVREETPSLIQKFYKPKAVTMERYRSFPWEKYSRPAFANEYVINATISSSYSMLVVRDLLLTSETRYDSIILTRFDINLTSPFVVENHDMNKVHIPKENHYSDGCNYWMAISSAFNILKHTNLYYNLDQIFNTGIEFIPQKVVYQNLQYNKLEYQTSIGTNGLLR